MRDFGMNVSKAGSWQELEQVVNASIGPSGFMEFARFNLGLILSKKRDAGTEMRGNKARPRPKSCGW
jgi:hypothetical protein